ncbi:MAG TPA: DUF3247 family protein [Xanthomonadaceae bacterium]|nr:DUF3247 family protein [Xanthomonadaceae bacterium]
MARIADRVYTDQHDIARLEATIKALDIGDRVSLLMADDEVVQGIVAVKPSVQVFFDHAGREGLNAMVRLEDPALDHPESAGWRDLWVDAIREVRHHNPP